MTEEFAPEENITAAIPESDALTEELAPEENITMAAIPKRDPSSNNKEQHIVCITITGPLAAVKQTIFTLYQLGFAEVEDWSPIQRGADPKQAISVLIRRKRAVGAVPPCPPLLKTSKQQVKKSGSIE